MKYQVPPRSLFTRPSFEKYVPPPSLPAVNPVIAPSVLSPLPSRQNIVPPLSPGSAYAFVPYVHRTVLNHPPMLYVTSSQVETTYPDVQPVVMPTLWMCV